MAVKYLALVLDEDCRAQVSAKFKPRFPLVKTHHVTIIREFTVDATDKQIEKATSDFKECEFVAVGYSCNHETEALQVRCYEDGFEITLTGKPQFHLTLSVQPPAVAADANKLYDYTPIESIRLSGKVQMLERSK